MGVNVCKCVRILFWPSRKCARLHMRNEIHDAILQSRAGVVLRNAACADFFDVELGIYVRMLSARKRK